LENIRTASAILRVMMEEGELDRAYNKDLFMSYISEFKIQEILQTMTEELDAQILRVNNMLYLIPSTDNQLLGFRNRDVREWLGSNVRQVDAFLAYYVVAVIFNLFYGGRNSDPKQRDFLSLVSIIEEVDKRMKDALSYPDKAAELDQEYSMNFMNISQIWDIKKGYEEGSRLTTKLGFLLRVVKLLQQEGLLRISENEKEIRATKKLDNLMLHYYLNDDRVQEIQKIFKEDHHAEN